LFIFQTTVFASLAGLMGQVADSALAHNGKVYGIIPKFMQDLEWGHKHVTQLVEVNSMHERKQKMADMGGAIIALPGGVGTFEELLEVLTWKKLGLYLNPIIIMNIRGYYDPLIEMLNKSIEEKFMSTENAKMWQVCTDADQVLNAILTSEAWSKQSTQLIEQMAVKREHQLM